MQKKKKKVGVGEGRSHLISNLALSSLSQVNGSQEAASQSGLCLSFVSSSNRLSCCWTSVLSPAKA